MIFLTVGTQLPFDRLVRTVDEWAGAMGRPDVFAQIGPSTFRPKHLDWVPFVDAHECRARVEACDLVVAHAGMGSVITALELGKPIIVMPRRASLGEHRNDHQLATARELNRQARATVAFDEIELWRNLERVNSLGATHAISGRASAGLVAALRRFVIEGAAAVTCCGEIDTPALADARA